MPVPLTDAHRTTLRRQREHLGMSQSDLARAADCPRQQICMLESGARQPSERFLRSVADALRLTVSIEQTCRVRFGKR